MQTLIRIKDKFQVTIPAMVRQQMDLQHGDYLEVSIDNGSIQFKPVPKVATQENPLGILAFINKTRKNTRSREAIDTALNEDRNAW